MLRFVCPSFLLSSSWFFVLLPPPLTVCVTPNHSLLLSPPLSLSLPLSLCGFLFFTPTCSAAAANFGAEVRRKRNVTSAKSSGEVKRSSKGGSGGSPATPNFNSSKPAPGGADSLDDLYSQNKNKLDRLAVRGSTSISLSHAARAHTRTRTRTHTRTVI